MMMSIRNDFQGGCCRSQIVTNSFWTIIVAPETIKYKLGKEQSFEYYPYTQRKDGILNE